MSDTNHTPDEPFSATEDRQWASFAHFGGAIAILGFFSSWAAVLAILPALIIYLVLGKRGHLTRDEAREALNFQITMVGAIIVWAIVATILGALFWWLGPIWIVLGPLFQIIGWALVIIDVIFSIIGGVRVNNGGSYRYPFALRLVH
ncbi:hypothetical protein ASF62_00855 [Leifsonia sp. Leaf325]|nr:DUF4870 domain-containing protein [Leifsonia sp. Leaf325]KQQ95134.1 hypothetical protein ASF62_00855 [Leifsonia sp. Leaf325]